MAQIVDPALLDLIVRFSNARPQEIALSHTVLEDFSIDGDDAAIFFDEFEARFGGDLTPLYEHWTSHFNNEGVSWAEMARLIPGALVLGGVAGSLEAWLDLPRWIALGLAVVALLLWLGPLGSWPFSRLPLIPIRVRDLMEVIDSGRWPLSYGNKPMAARGPLA